MTRAPEHRRRHVPPPSWLVPGARVDYHAVIGGPVTAQTVVRTDPWQLGDGTWVVAIVGKAGGVAVAALTRTETNP